VSGEVSLAEQLRAMVDKAERALRAAERHLADGDADFASSKAYYAAFHLMQAALLTQQRTYSKHAGVLAGFSEHFIKPGVVPTDFGQKLQRLRKDREVGDYGYLLRIDPAAARSDVETARQLFTALTTYLQPFLAQ